MPDITYSGEISGDTNGNGVIEIQEAYTYANDKTQEYIANFNSNPYNTGYSSDVANSNYYYKYFGAFTSTNNYGTVGNQWGQSGVYQWYHVTDRKSYADTQGSYYWYRVNYYTSSYTDYTKYYDYYRDLYYQTTDPGNGSNISNKVAYVKYKL